MNSPSIAGKLHLFGAPRLERLDTPIPIERRKALALLTFLALTGQAHLRDSLATLLWPDSGQALGRANLRHTLVVLKQALGDSLLDIERETVALKHDATFWVDALHFQTLLAKCRAPKHVPNEVCAVCLPLLLEAVELHAEHFMAGFSLADSAAYDDWQRAQQQQLLAALSDALDRLVRYFIQTNEPKAAIEYAQRRLGLDTLDEAAHRQLMQLYAWSGQQGLAQRQFEQCTAVLEKELEVSPSAETVRLMQEIQAGRITVHASVTHASNGHHSEPKVDNEGRPAEPPRHNLPMRLPALIGRDHDLHTLQAMLQRSDLNLVTLVGPGGVGKTLLSQQTASSMVDAFADGVFFVSLAPLREAEQVPSALAQLWDLPPQGNQPLEETITNYLRHKQMLLILDNFEHLMAATPVVSHLVAHCAHLRVIVTSRERLNVQGEHLYAVAPLSLPKRRQDASLAPFAETPLAGAPFAETPFLEASFAEASAVQLFVQRAQALTSMFMLDESNAGDIADVCTALDGLPLAIELVAARTRVMPPRALRQRLLGPTASAFQLLQGGTRDAPPRHRTLKDTIAWSCDLLTDVEQRLFRLLPIFVGGCTLEAVERVSELVGATGSESVIDVLASLVNKSLIQQTVYTYDESRFSMLDLVREYALEQLRASHEFTAVARAHAETYAAFVETAVPALSGQDHLAWIAQLDADHDNCLAALQWAITNQDAELALRLGSRLWHYWMVRGYYRGRQFLSTILQLTGAAGRTPHRASVLTGLATICGAQGDHSEGRSCLDEAISICRECGDEHGLALALEKFTEDCFMDPNLIESREFWIPKSLAKLTEDYILDPRLIEIDDLRAEAVALYDKVDDWMGATRMRRQFGHEQYSVGDYQAAQATFEEALNIYGAHKHEAELARTLTHLGRALFQQQKFAEASQRFAEALLRAQARGEQAEAANVRYFMGRIAYYQGDHVKAKSLLEEALRINRKLGTKGADIAFPSAFLSAIALAQGDLATAQNLLRESLPLLQQEDDVYPISLLLPHCADVAAFRGQHTDAVKLVAAGRSLYPSLLMLPPNDQAAFDAPLAVVRPLLSTEEFTQAWDAGARLTMADAVALALTATSDHPPTHGVLQSSATHHP